MVYVDGMKAGFRRMIMCHMVADTNRELLDMASKIGVHHRWIQKPGTPDEHFDICLSKKKLAIESGAMEVTQRDLFLIIDSKRPNPRFQHMLANGTT